jgi:hypothetical protein
MKWPGSKPMQAEIETEFDCRRQNEIDLKITKLKE